MNVGGEWSFTRSDKTIVHLDIDQFTLAGPEATQKVTGVAHLESPGRDSNSRYFDRIQIFQYKLDGLVTATGRFRFNIFDSVPRSKVPTQYDGSLQENGHLMGTVLGSPTPAAAQTPRRPRLLGEFPYDATSWPGAATPKSTTPTTWISDRKFVA